MHKIIIIRFKKIENKYINNKKELKWNELEFKS